jgi:hypothetical protein
MRHARHLLLFLLLLTADPIDGAINLDFLAGRAPRRQPPAECRITIVGFRFRGQPGQVFEYAGERFEIDAERYVEVIAHRRRMTYMINGVQVPLKSAPTDPFGFVDAELPAPLK